jgi:uncharacterized protein YxeA
MKEVIITALAVSALTYAIVTFETEPTHDQTNPYIQWSDSANPPVPGFEQHVDMYYSEDRDTIYMERSFGPEAE